jgi:hypothetical protein
MPITPVEARELIARPSALRRRPTDEFIESRRANRRKRIDSGLKLSDLNSVELWEEFLPIVGSASYFNLVLDTTAPQGASLSLNGGAATSNVAAITARLSTSDNPATGYQIKIWGAVNTGANASIQTTEGASAWISPTWAGTSYADQAVTLSATDGSKTIFAKIRDDVWNETSQLSASITLDTTIPVVSITTGPDATKISTVSGKRVTNFTFQTDQAVSAWEVEVVATSGSARGTGTVIGTTNGSTNTSGGALAATTGKDVSLDGRDVQAASAGDGTKVIKVFAQNAAGTWSS